MKIVIDLQGAQSESRHRGIGRHTMALVQAFTRLAGAKHELWIATNAQLGHVEEIKSAFQALVPVERIVSFSIPAPVAGMDPGSHARANAAELVRENFLRELAPDIVWTSSLFEGWVDDTVTSIGRLPVDCFQAVTLYDLIPLSDKERFLARPDVRAWYFRKLGFLERADALLAISQYAREEAIELLNIAPERIRTVSSAVDDQFRMLGPDELAGVELPIELKTRFVLYVGGFDDRKNVDMLIRAYAELPRALRQTHVLVLGGKINTSQEEALRELSARVGLNKDEVRFTGKITDEQLIQLYSRCALFVFPSLQEGFGLSVLEAMACGAPVLAANATSIPEVVGCEEMLFDPVDVSGLSAKMTRVLEDPALADAYRSHGLAQSKQFSWESSARRVLEAFESLIASGRSAVTSPADPLSRRRRLAFVSPLPPERSGIADYSAELLPSLQRYYDIEVIVAQRDVSDPWITSNYPVRTVAWFVEHANEFDRILYHFGNSAFHLHQFELMRQHPGTVVLHDSFIGALSRWRAAHAGSDQPYLQRLYHSHGYPALVEDQEKGREWSVQHYPSSWEVLEHAAGVLVHSRYAIDQVERFYGTRCAQELRRIPFPKRRRASSRDASRRALGIAPGDFVVCSFGMVAPTKLNGRILSAWLASSLCADATCHLVFVGENHGAEYGADLLAAMRASEARDRIRITGFVDEAQYHAWLESADLAIQLRTESRGETSAAVFDCMAQGLPIIVNAHATFAELDKEAVLMLPDQFGDNELIEAMEILLAQPDRRQAMSARARHLINTEHHPSSVSAQYADAIEYFAEHHFLSRERQLGKLLAADQGLTDQDWWRVARAMFNNRRPRRQSTLFVDVTAVVRDDHKTGIERVTRNIARQLLLGAIEDVRVELVRFYGGRYVYARDYACALLGVPSLGLPEEAIDATCGDIFFGLDWVADLTPANQALFEAWRDRGVSVHFMVYDLLPVLRPEFFPAGIDRMHAKWLRSIAACADGLICISKTVAGELSGWLSTQSIRRSRSLRIGYSYLGAELEASQANTESGELAAPTRAVVESMGARTSLLMVGTMEPRKGHRQAVEAFEQLWANGSDVQLVIVGKLGWMMDDLGKRIESHPEYGSRLHWLRGINDVDLRAIYGAAAGLLVASEGEGFGLPIIEAANHGLPVIARDIPVFREVAGSHAHYFLGKAGADMAHAVAEWLQSRKAGHPLSPGVAVDVLSWAQSGRTVGRMLVERGHANWVRDVMCGGVRLSLGEAGLLLDMRYISDEYLPEGWSKTEPWGRWATGSLARISMDLTAPKDAHLVLAIEADAFVCEGCPRQAFSLKVNGELLGHWTQAFGEPSPVLRWLVPPSFVAGTRRLDIDLLQADAVSPAMIGLSADERVLGLAVRKIELQWSRSGQGH
ncbi:glycosyltransferase [Dyella sp. ASV21]|uniref:glycosyltransferase n=1 Tax=Dyella sp. ASV21 TaxID=2795114 RepID=UPI0018EBDC03|nr:glycosyltransferase [Dyella sp. ASV21]